LVLFWGLGKRLQKPPVEAELPGPAGRSKDDHEAAELAAVLEAARKALRSADGWTIEPSLYDRLRADLSAIGLCCNDCIVTLALRAAFAEITRLRRRADPSYSGLEAGQTLFQCRWKSDHFKREMYIKFAMNEGIVELLRLHEHREGKNHEVH
jgi:hypothetical protein